MICENNTIEKNITDQIVALYEYSFPPEERRDSLSLRRLLNENGQLQSIIYTDGSDLIGFILYHQLEQCNFVEHFAVDQASRGSGIGSTMFTDFLAQHPGPVVLEVELPETEIARRRIGFYERLGLKSWPEVAYVQPSYGPQKPALPLMLMSRDVLSEDQLIACAQEIHHKVYGK